MKIDFTSVKELQSHLAETPYTTLDLASTKVFVSAEKQADIEKYGVVFTATIRGPLRLVASVPVIETKEVVVGVQVDETLDGDACYLDGVAK